jgi:iron complex transport system substrate-binding protein
MKIRNGKERLLLYGLLIALTLAWGVWEGAGAEAAAVLTREQRNDNLIRVITDMTGKRVTIPAKVNRVGTGGAINQMVLMLGGADKIVATSTVVQVNPMFVKIYPKIKTIAAPFVITDANIEELLKTKPDVVFGGNVKMESLGFPVIQLSLRDPEEIKQAVMLVGQVLGPEEEKRAVQFCRYYDSNMKRVTDGTRSLAAAKRMKVYYAAGNKGTFTDGKGSITTAWIEMAGGVNVAAEAGMEGLSREVSMEDLVAWNPDVIIATDPAMRDKILHSDQWKNISAVKNNRVHLNPKGVYLWSVRSAEEALQVLWAAKVIQPGLFADLDLDEEVRKFYKIYYHYNLTRDELHAIING